jgi:hypothetical protein
MNVQRSIFASVGIALLFATARFAEQESMQLKKEDKS